MSQGQRTGLKTECSWLAVNTRDDTEKQASVGPCLIRSLVRCLIRSLVRVKEISQDAKWKRLAKGQRSRTGLKTECSWLAVNTRDDTEKQASVGPCLIRSLVRCLIRSLVPTSLSDSTVLVWFDRPCLIRPSLSDSTVLVISDSTVLVILIQN
jgi:hypothetical protein